MTGLLPTTEDRKEPFTRTGKAWGTTASLIVNTPADFLLEHHIEHLQLS
ncbi:MAG: hypothetical protein ACO3XO_08585 [Bdellovibrionota bacterium]